MKDNRKAYEALMKVYPLTTGDLDGEVWADIAGYEGRYQVSTHGRVKSFLNNKVLIVCPRITKKGYLQLGLSKNGKKKFFRVSRLVAQAFIPNPDAKPEVNHINGIKIDNRAKNLEWTTSSENKLHAFANGLNATGAERSQAKLTNEQVALIRENPDNLTQSQLAKKFHVCKATIYNVQVGKSYFGAGGTVRKAQLAKSFVEEKIRQEIRRVYIKGDKEFGARALGRKYGIEHSSVLRIVKEK